MSEVFGCVANTIKLRSGNYFDFNDCLPIQFEFADIAGALSKICRFGGQCEPFYSVAEHCYHCSRVAQGDGRNRDEQIALLMHDASEAFVGDMVKPLKVLLPDFQKVEKRIEKVISEKYRIDFEKHEWCVKEIDMAMLIAERRAMFDPDTFKWTGEDSVRHLSVEFKKWGPQDAESFFTSRARELGVI